MKILLLMKASSTTFSSMTLCVVLITCMNIKQNIGHVWFLGPHTLGKLIFLITCMNIKQNLGHVRFLGPYTLGKLIFLITCMNIKQNLGYV